MLSKIIIGSFGIEYQWLQWCQAAHICHNIRYLLMESMPYKSVFCKTHTKISKECLSFIGFVYYLFLSEKNWIFVNIVSAGEPQTFKTIWKRTNFLHCMLFWTHTLFWLSASKSNFKTKNVSSLVRAARVYVCVCECVCINATHAIDGNMYKRTVCLVSDLYCAAKQLTVQSLQIKTKN